MRQTMKNQALFLVAEDDPDDQYFFQEAVEAGCPPRIDTHFVWDGAQLISFLRQIDRETRERYLVVLDLNMRVKDGRTTLREIKTDPILADIPVVILTTSDSEEDAEYCKRYGVAAYYRKPNSIVELVQIVRTLCTDYLN
jgi:CheY-like chemotaxis protein